MCGILGSINLEFDEKILNTLYHRGPDSGAICEIVAANNTIRLGHRRLAIVDLTESGNQPMTSPDEQFYLIFNGEIYNHLELRAKLPDIIFKGTSDTETILHYLIRYGIEAVKDFNGIFALGFYDVQNNKMFLVRDRFGVKPLYYAYEDKSLVFASEIRPIRQMKKLHMQTDHLAPLLKLRYLPAPYTLFAEVNKIKPGHIATYNLSDHSLEHHTYIQNIHINKNTSFNKAVEHYGDLFEKAVQRQLMSDVEIGSLLSGGVDSALVTYFAQKHSAKPIKTYTVGFNHDSFENEIKEAEKSARFLKTDHRAILIDENNFKDIFEETCRIVEEPLGTTSILPMYYLNKEVGKELKVVLTGQGIDEPLGGYRRYQGEIWSQKMPHWFFSLARPFAGFTKKEGLIRAANSLSERDPIRRFEKIYTLFSDAEIQKLINKMDDISSKSIRYFYDLLNGNSKKSVDAMMAVDMRMNLPDDLLLYTDKVSMHFSIETRVPVLDIELMNFVETLPLEYKIHKGSGKHIHKVFAASVLPDEIISRPKKGFMSPTEKWFREDLGNYYLDLLSKDTSAFSEVFDLKEVAKIFKQHQSGFNKEKQLFTLLSVYYWFQNNK